MTGALRVEVLGPLRVLWEGEPVGVGAHQMQTLLAVLALRANQVCPSEELLDLVWHDKPPGSGLKVLPPYIYRLRRSLPIDILDRTSDGYILRLPPGSLDVTEFETLAARASALRDNGELDAAASAYNQALTLCRGEPLSGLPGPYLAAQRRRLTERRDKVFADRVDVDLDRDRAADLVAELVPAVAARPFDERLAGQLMRALSADGRQAEALEVYTRARDTLIDQLGVEPGPALREVHRTILRNEATESVRDELPYAGAVFVGRQVELERLDRALITTGATAPPVVTIDGMPGTGKTALAVYAARRLAGRYPDGILFVDLHGHTPGRQPRATKSALDHLLVGAGVGAGSIPHSLEEAQILWRTTVAGQRLLVVLDNAATSTTVARLLPGSPTCGVLVTSRNQLTGLDTGHRLHLGLLRSEDAAALLARLVGAERTAADVAGSNHLVDACGRLPLAIRIAGARLRHRPTWSIAHINKRLDRTGRRLAELTADGLGVITAFQLSYGQLDADQQQLFRLLSLLPGRDLDQYGAAALLDRSPDDASDLAESLVDANLLLQPMPGRYEFHDLIRAYATELAEATDSPESLEAATDRLLEYYLHASIHPRAFHVGGRYVEVESPPTCALPVIDTRDKAKAWADAEADNLVAAIERAASTGRRRQTWQLTLLSIEYLSFRGMIQQRDHALELALEAARELADPETEARVLHATGRVIREHHGFRAAADRLQQALQVLPDDGDRLLRGQIFAGLGQALQSNDPYGAALPALQEAVRVAHELGHDRLLAQSLAYIGILLANEADYEAAIDTLREAIAVYQRFGPTGLTADVLSSLSHSCRHLGRTDEALDSATAALDLAVELGNAFSVTMALVALGSAHRQRGDIDRAVDVHRRAIAAGDALGMQVPHWESSLELARSLVAAGDLDDAFALCQAVLEEAGAVQDNFYMVEAWETLASHAAAGGDRQASAAYLSQAMSLADEFLPGRVASLRAQLDVLTG
ncbi:tetratricopeptide repeat protein [Kribbella sp. NBC_01505]|uniref:AfsR/SARP family transcriptional regulator n=1 Tax=Kribbella sp. NBC_01505 TaxID=2903580 RepID=UPI00386AAA09